MRAAVAVSRRWKILKVEIKSSRLSRDYVPLLTLFNVFLQLHGIYSTAEQRPGDRRCPKRLEITYINLVLIKEQHECKTLRAPGWIHRFKCRTLNLPSRVQRFHISAFKPLRLRFQTKSGHQSVCVWIRQTWKRNTESVRNLKLGIFIPLLS